MKTAKLAQAGSFLLLVLSSAPLLAQQYPTRAVTVVVGFPPGSGNDTALRIIAPTLEGHLGQKIVVDNRPGAGGMIGTAYVAKAKPDGYTLLTLTGADTLQVAIQPNLSYDIERDFVAVASLITAGVPLMVSPSLPARNLKELIALAKAQPGKLRYGSSGIGSSGHLQAELLRALAQIDIQHIPYKGSPEASTATITGEVDMSFGAMALAKSLSQSGKVRVVGVSSAIRSPAMPEVPTLSEAGVPEYDYSQFYGLVAPRGTSMEAIQKLNAAVARTLATPAVRDALISTAGLTPQIMTPEEFSAYVKRQIEQNGRLVKSIGLKAE
jgi:tripartite-type tricarboxylate transporter receptor subunit TctC